MKYLPNRAVWSFAIVLSLLVILIVLAVLQYRWSGQISDAERERMETSLRNATLQFRAEFNRELLQLAAGFLPETSVVAARDWQRYARAVGEARSGNSRRLVTGVFLWVKQDGDGGGLLRFVPESVRFVPAPWTPVLEAARSRFEGGLTDYPRLPPETRPFMWTVISRVPLFLHPLVDRTMRAEPGAPPPAPIGYLIVELSLDALREDLLTELAQRYFGGPGGFIYEVAVVSRFAPETVIYQSNADLSPAIFDTPDARIGLLEGRGGRGMRWPPGKEAEFRFPEEPRPPGPMPGMGMARQGGRRGGPFIMSELEGGGWELVVRHRQGSLETVVARQRQRNLAVSFGILLLLAVSTALIVGFTQRTHKLAKLQMDFVAGVSHELRTPLAVICSAADNLAEGVVADSNLQIKKYGELIREEARKLTGMVEQVLQYASIQSGRRQYHLEPVLVADIVEDTVRKAMPSIQAAGFEIEQDIDPSPYAVNADPAALSQSLRNLINNALKYSGDSRRLAVRTSAGPGRAGQEVLISVEDHGIGIEPADLPNIFEPFFRGRPAVAAQIHGSGLGLAMAREAVVAMGGEIRVKSVPGKGSVFTIHLPALPLADASPQTDSHEAD